MTLIAFFIGFFIVLLYFRWQVRKEFKHYGTRLKDTDIIGKDPFVPRLDYSPNKRGKTI